MKKYFLLIAFYLESEITEFPIVRTLQVSKNRVTHVVHLYKISDIDEQLLG